MPLPYAVSLVASAERAAGTVNSADQGGYTPFRGVGILVDVSAEPGASTWDLAVHVHAKDHISGNYTDSIGSVALDETDGAGTYYLSIYPSAGATTDMPMPRIWRASAVLTGVAAAEVQTITLTGFAGTDSFKLTAETNETIAFVRGTNATAAAIQTALRTATGDNGLTVSGATDAGPFVVTFAEVTDQPPITVTSAVGCSGSVSETQKGGNVLTYSVSAQKLV